MGSFLSGYTYVVIPFRKVKQTDDSKHCAMFLIARTQICISSYIIHNAIYFPWNTSIVRMKNVNIMVIFKGFTDFFSWTKIRKILRNILKKCIYCTNVAHSMSILFTMSLTSVNVIGLLYFSFLNSATQKDY